MYVLFVAQGSVKVTPRMGCVLQVCIIPFDLTSSLPLGSSGECFLFENYVRFLLANPCIVFQRVCVLCL